MIDYDKLKMAMELAEKYSDITHTTCSLKAVFMPDNTYACYFQSVNHPNDFFELDGLIARLQELTQPKPKYEVGQIAAYIDEDNIPVEFVIEGVCEFGLNSSYWESKEDDVWHFESELYPSKEALIEAQINIGQIF